MVVAVIAAVASIVAAVLAWLSSRTATAGAREVASLNHRIVKLDREAEQLRADFAAFVVASGEAHDAAGQSKMLAAGLVLGANPRCGQGLRDAADTYTTSITATLLKLGGSSGLLNVEQMLQSLRAGFADSMVSINDERDAILARQRVLKVELPVISKPDVAVDVDGEHLQAQ